jgi:uncharacterized protein
MSMIRILANSLLGLVTLAAAALPAHGADAVPIVIGESLTVESVVLGETRRINVYMPPGYAEAKDMRYPVLYMPDGGLAEDFLHIAGLVQVSVGNATMRPCLLVGIENTQRRRDLTGPSVNEEDKKIAPRVGGSEAFRKFIRTELMPVIRNRYRTTNETAIVGESLAGLFVVETFLLAPDLFDTYIAVDPSLWWNNGDLVARAPELIRGRKGANKALFLANSDQSDIADLTKRLATVLERSAERATTWHYVPMPAERHSTIFHPAALTAFRTVLGLATPAAAK